MNELQRQGNTKLLIALVGNKTDVQDRQVTLQEAQDYATDNHLLYIETSAKLGTNVCQVFTEIGKNNKHI